MIKNIFIALLGLVMLFSFSAQAMAENKGNDRKGKHTYRKIFKSCFKKGMVDSPKPPISPDEKTQAQWKRLFDKKKFKAFGCQEEWAKLTEKQLLNIYTYLYAHAADSPSPAKCK